MILIFKSWQSWFVDLEIRLYFRTRLHQFDEFDTFEISEKNNFNSRNKASIDLIILYFIVGTNNRIFEGFW